MTTRRELRRAFNIAFRNFQRTKSHKWRLALRKANLALMALSVRSLRSPKA